MAKVFLSSTYTEMAEYRKAAREAIEDRGHDCVCEEKFTAADREVNAYCTQKVRECELFVLILGQLYGSAPAPDAMSYTEGEFEAALQPPALTRLVFLASPQARTNIAQVLPQLAAANIDINRQYKEQARFADRARKGVLFKPFNSPADLKYWVGFSLDQWRAKPADAPASPKGPSPIIPLLCDRQPQLEAFHDSLRQASPGIPHIYALHGDAGAQHRSCIERLLCYHIRHRRPAEYNARFLSPERRVIRWPDRRDPPEVILARLYRALFESLDPEAVPPRDNIPAAFCDLAAAQDSGYFLFRHLFRTPEMDEPTRNLIQTRYLPFWDEVAGRLSVQGGAPRMLVFFEVKHPLDQAEAEVDRFHQELVRLFPERSMTGLSRCFVLPPLRSVDFPELELWYEQHNRALLPKFRYALPDELFAGTPWPMNRVERLLCEMTGVESYE